jgi:hypothetical protein
MGAWGSGLYANDVTCDVRDTYMKYLQDQLGNIEAYELTIKNFKECIGDEDEPLLWYALADTQWRMGRLMPEVKEKAQLWIKEGGGLALWEESKNGGAGWKKTLSKLEAKLKSPTPPEKTIKKPVQFTRNPWNVGDLYAYQFNTDIAKERGVWGKYIVFQKVGNAPWCDGKVFSIIQVFDQLFDSIPVRGDIEGIRILPLIDSSIRELKRRETKEDYIKYFNRYLKACMIYQKKHHYPKAYFYFTGNQPVSDVGYHHSQYTEASWEKEDLDEWISDFYLQWKNIEY